MGSNGMRVAILFHARERHFGPAGYLVHHLAELWRQDGLEVVYLYGTDRFVPADLVLVHVGPSVVPEPYLEFAARYPTSSTAASATSGKRSRAGTSCGPATTGTAR
jgi:hypothetical protein